MKDYNFDMTIADIAARKLAEGKISQFEHDIMVEQDCAPIECPEIRGVYVQS